MAEYESWGREAGIVSTTIQNQMLVDSEDRARALAFLNYVDETAHANRESEERRFPPMIGVGGDLLSVMYEGTSRSRVSLVMGSVARTDIVIGELERGKGVTFDAQRLSPRPVAPEPTRLPIALKVEGVPLNGPTRPVGLWLGQRALTVFAQERHVTDVPLGRLGNNLLMPLEGFDLVSFPADSEFTPAQIAEAKSGVEHFLNEEPDRRQAASAYRNYVAKHAKGADTRSLVGITPQGDLVGLISKSDGTAHVFVAHVDGEDVISSPLRPQRGLSLRQGNPHRALEMPGEGVHIFSDLLPRATHQELRGTLGGRNIHFYSEPDIVYKRIPEAGVAVIGVLGNVPLLPLERFELS